MATTSTTARFLPAPAPIVAFFSGVIAFFERKSAQSQIRSELSTMSDRELADLGLNYSDIDDVAAGTYSRD